MEISEVEAEQYVDIEINDEPTNEKPINKKKEDKVKTVIDTVVGNVVKNKIEDKVEDEKKENSFILKITFLLIGISCLNVWNSALGLDMKIDYNKFQMAGLLISSVSSLFMNIPKILMPVFFFFLAVLCSGFQILHKFGSDEVFDTYSIIAFFAMGILGGYIQAIAFRVATTLKKNYSGYISTGIGLSSVITFSINLLLDLFVSQEKKYKINKQKLQFLFGVAELSILITLILMLLYLNLSTKEKIQIQKKEEKSLSYIDLIKDSYKAILAMFLINWLTLNLFPGVGHKKWVESHNFTPKHITFLVGMFQLFDFIGRYPPNLHHIKYFKYFNFPLNTLLILTVIRMLFIPWFIFNIVFHFAPFSNYVQQCICMALFAFTNGWFNTVTFLAFIKELKIAKSKEDIEKISNLLVVALFLGLASGIYTTPMYNFIPIPVADAIAVPAA
ncbi:nucleoside transporter 1, putative [Hepatocystis sp. ex Piliocolobus tephrosceles]|nr:nucleoside transporter 1, putative [Hepatocystis sp. ex Piliocolobus tephrosceles]